ncbi:MAG: precorrin-2 dehydrogenase/sirohydrochlorin ferrochelatase family protein [Cellulosilyticaceae bacterium]
MYPAMLNVEGKCITIIGGGKVAYRKAKVLLSFGAKLRVVSPAFEEAFEKLEGDITLLKRCFGEVEEELRGSFIVIAATDKRGLNEQIGKYCDTHHILCNVIDDKHLSSFIVPAYIRRGDLILSVSTNGHSPSLTKKIKEALAETYDESYGEYVAILGRMRERILQDITDETSKRQQLHHLIEMDLEELRAYEKSYING